jgi:GNAT superfamily N-acetyltransferase
MIAMNTFLGTTIGHQIVEVNAPAVLEDIYRLRVKAWRTKLTLSTDITEWRDGFESRSRHWVIFDQLRLVAAARLTVCAALKFVPDAEVYTGIFLFDPPGPIASLNRLVVDPEYRGLGFARQFDAVRLRAAKVAGCRHVVGATSEPSRERQLESAGFVIYRPLQSNSHVSGLVAGVTPTGLGLLSLQAVSKETRAVAADKWLRPL